MIKIDKLDLHKSKEIPLTSEQREIFITFIEKINNAHEARKIQIIYRGEKQRTLTQKLRNEYGSKKFFEYLFLVGEKAKSYFRESKQSRQERNYLKAIQDTSSETFQYIFQELNQRFVSSQSEHNKRIDDFMITDTGFVEFFLKTENQLGFLELICKTDDNKKKLTRDYYLFLLHTLGIGEKSFFLSTTTDYRVAEDFARNRRGEGCVFYGFIPQPICFYGVSLSSHENLRSLLSGLGLPIYTTSFYPTQHEIALKGGLFPHHIIGVRNLNDNHFFINPHILSSKNQSDFDGVIERGLSIDQEGFEDFIKSTGYAGYITRFYQDRNYPPDYTDQFHR